jgi:hypothetical protein
MGTVFIVILSAPLTTCCGSHSLNTELEMMYAPGPT